MAELRPNFDRAGKGDDTFCYNNFYNVLSDEPSLKVQHNTKVSKPYTSLSLDPEAKRLHRLAKYKFYSAERKLKVSFKRGFRWFKTKCMSTL